MRFAATVNLVECLSVCPLTARIANQARTNQRVPKHSASTVVLAHLKMTRAQKLAKNVAKDNIRINPVMKPVWIVKWVGT